jgi:flavin reductase (DIM6/NTAB) family NADH-FMN oxidoreductase RutF
MGSFQKMWTPFAECFANLECQVVNTSLVKKYDLLVLEVVKAWTDQKHTERRTIHLNGNGTFVDGKTINLQKQMTKWQAFVD